MTRRDYELIADVLRLTLAMGEVEPTVMRSLAIRFADRFAAGNERFDRERFVRAVMGVFA